MKTLLAKLLGISRSLLDFFLPIFQALIAGSLERLLPIALAIVTELATSQLSGSEKKTVAVDRLKKAAMQEGLTVSASALNLLVESAVANLKASTK
jgi:hypothetical protein